METQEQVILLLHLSSTDRLQQVEDNVRGRIWHLKKAKAINTVHLLVIDIGDNSLVYLNRAIHNYGKSLPLPVRYRTREKWFLSLSNLSRRDNERRGTHVPCLPQGCPFSSYFFGWYFINHVEAIVVRCPYLLEGEHK